MSEWTDGYRAALADIRRTWPGRGVAGMLELLTDLEGDALVIEREADNRIRKRRLAAAREAELPFEEPPP
jgi:hypothetical protein